MSFRSEPTSCTSSNRHHIIRSCRSTRDISRRSHCSVFQQERINRRRIQTRCSVHRVGKIRAQTRLTRETEKNQTTDSVEPQERRQPSRNLITLCDSPSSSTASLVNDGRNNSRSCVNRSKSAKSRSSSFRNEERSWIRGITRKDGNCKRLIECRRQRSSIRTTNSTASSKRDANVVH